MKFLILSILASCIFVFSSSAKAFIPGCCDFQQPSQTEQVIKRVELIGQDEIDAVGAKELTVKNFYHDDKNHTYILILEDGTKVQFSESVKFILY